MTPYKSDDLIQFIEAAGESTNIDAKRSMEWDGGEASAGLMKDIVSFANSRDGGVIVIGKEESSPGKFVLMGLTAAQADSFETTKVAAWVNSRCDPPVTLVCNRVEHDGKEFIVLTVAEFDDTPVMCSKHYELPGKPPKVLLRKGAIYVRTANAESAPLSSIEDLRTLIGLATTKRADQMLSMFQAMMKGRSLLETKPNEELFRAEREEVRSALDSELGGRTGQGAWTFMCHPVRHEPTRWDETSQLRTVVDKSAVRTRRPFPPIDHNTHVREWGICNRRLDDAFGLARSGLFVAVRLFRENSIALQNQWQPNPDIPAGEWLDYKLNLAVVIEFFVFVSRFADHFEIGEELVVELAAEPLTGRRLGTMDHDINLDPTEPAKASRFRHRKVVTVETLRADWEKLCVKALAGFLELFSGPNITDDTLLSWVEKFKERRFD